MSSAKVSSPYEIDSRFSEIYVLGSHHTSHDHRRQLIPAREITSLAPEFPVD
jgi:hypothetical protein